MKKIIFTILIVFGATVTMANDNALNEEASKIFEKSFQEEKKATEHQTLLGKTYNKNTRTLTYYWLDRRMDLRGLSKAQISKFLNNFRENYFDAVCSQDMVSLSKGISNLKVRYKFYDLNEFHDAVLVYDIAKDCKGRY